MKLNATMPLEKEALEFLDALAKSSDRDRRYPIKKAVKSHISLYRWPIEEVRSDFRPFTR